MKSGLLLFAIARTARDFWAPVRELDLALRRCQAPRLLGAPRVGSGFGPCGMSQGLEACEHSFPIGSEIQLDVEPLQELEQAAQLAVQEDQAPRWR